METNLKEKSLKNKQKLTTRQRTILSTLRKQNPI